MRKFDLMYRNAGQAAATKITQGALAISRANAKDSGPWDVPKIMSQEGAALAKITAPGNPFEIPYLNDRRERFSVSDDEPEAWRKFKPGDDPASIHRDPLSVLVERESGSEEGGYDDYSDEPEIEDEDEEPLEAAATENEELAQTGGAFDKQRLYRATTGWCNVQKRN